MWERFEREFPKLGVEIVYFPYTTHTSSTLLRERLLDLPAPRQAVFDDDSGRGGMLMSGRLSKLVAVAVALGAITVAHFERCGVGSVPRRSCRARRPP